MLTEEGLLLVLILGACAVVVLGTLELAWPTRPRHTRRRSTGALEVRRVPRPRPVVVAPALEPVPLAVVRPTPIMGGLATGPPTPPDARGGPAKPDRPSMTLVTATPVTAAPVEPVALNGAEAPAAETVPLTDADGGFALVKRGRFGEAITLARRALAALKSDGTSAPTTVAAQETARLWGLVGLAQKGLGEVEDARFALEEAIAHAPGSERSTWERELAALALEVGRRPLDAPDGASAADRIASLEAALEWLDRGLAIAPDAAELAETRSRAHEALWATHEAAIAALVQNKDLIEARHRLDEAMTDPECPAERRRALGALLARTLSGQARQATADALRHRLGGREDQAMAALARGEDLLTPLSRAWPLTADDERGRQVRALLVETLEEIVDARAEDIERMIDAGDTSLALIHAEKLWSLVRAAHDQGPAREDLAAASARALGLFDRMSAGRPIDWGA